MKPRFTEEMTRARESERGTEFATREGEEVNRVMKRSIIPTTTAFAFVTLLGVSAASAQQPQPSPTPPPVPEPRPELRVGDPSKTSTIKGELVSVDTEAKLLTIKSDEGKTREIRYTDNTKVTGAQSGIAGLANTPATKVTVTLMGMGPGQTASEIIVEPAKR